MISRALFPALGAVLIFSLGSVCADEVINAGRGGNSSRNLLQRVQKDVIDREPTLVVIMVGTNDALNSAKLVPMDEYRTNIDELYRRIVAAGAEVIFVTPPPFLLPELLSRHEASAYGEISPEFRLAEVVATMSYVAQKNDTAVIDYHARLAEEGLVDDTAESVIRNPANSGSADGVHPTAKGYEILAGMVFNTIQAMKKPPGDLDTSRVICFGDSITYGAGMEGAGTAEGETYPAQLAKLLNAAAE